MLSRQKDTNWSLVGEMRVGEMSLTPNNKEDGDQIVLFLFMNAAHLLCQKLYFIFVYVLHSDQQ